MDEIDEDFYGSVFRSPIDDRVWMCNIPEVDVATGLVASTSLRKVKAYVEEVLRYDLGEGTWARSPSGDWQYRFDDEDGGRRGNHR